MLEPRRGQWRTRQRRRRRANLGEAVGVLALTLVVGSAALLERGRGGAEAADLAAHAGALGVDPATFVAAAGRAHRVVLLGDQPGRAEPKRIAAAAVEALALGPGLSAVVLELSADDQPVLDRYLESYPEAVAYLLVNLRSLQEPEPVAHAYVEILRRVWRINQDLGPTRRVRVLAADLPDWPPPAALPPGAAAERLAQRDAHMADRIMDQVLGRDPGARVLVFASNPHVLRTGPGQIRAGLAAPVAVEWLGARLSAAYPGEIFSIFVDAGARGPAVSYRSAAGSAAFNVFRRRVADTTRSFGLRVDDRFDFLGAAVTAGGVPGIRIDALPRWASMRDAVDGYVYTGTRRRRSE